MRSAQRRVRAHRQHPQRPTRQVAARHRSADLLGQADGSHKPRAACTKPRASVSEPLRVLRPLHHPRSEPQRPHPLRHRSTRTLNPLADAPPHQASPISIPNTTQATSALMIRRYATGAYLWHAFLLVALIRAQLRKCPVVMIRSTHFGVPPSVAVSAAKSVLSVLPVFLIAARNTSCDHTTQGGATQKSARDYARAPLQLNYILICFLTGRGFR